MSAAFGSLLKVFLPESVSEVLSQLLEVPFILRIVSAAALMMIVAAFLTGFFGQIDKLIGFLQSIRTGLVGLFNPSKVEADTRDRNHLLREFKSEIEGRLAYDKQMIALSLEDRPDELGRPQIKFAQPEAIVEASANISMFINGLLRTLSPNQSPRCTNQDPVTLKSSDRIIDVFERGDVAGRLLILGQPGAGKTTTLLELARELIARAEENPDAPVPIIFELSEWKDDKQSIDQWLVVRLKAEYSYLPLNTIRHWVKTHRILPLLDGLDELGLSRQKKCAEKINEFLLKGNPDLKVAVCCRTEEYRWGREMVELSSLKGAVELQPLSEKQIKTYLRKIGQPSLWKCTIQRSEELRELAQTPLMLTLMPTALANRPVQAKAELPVQAKAELFDAYIDQRFQWYQRSKWYRSKKGQCPYSRKQTLTYLKRLANNLETESRAIFLIETMQPRSWLQTKSERWQHNLALSLLSIFMLGSILTVTWFTVESFFQFLAAILIIFFASYIGFCIVSMTWYFALSLRRETTDISVDPKVMMKIQLLSILTATLTILGLSIVFFITGLSISLIESLAGGLAGGVIYGIATLYKCFFGSSTYGFEKPNMIIFDSLKRSSVLIILFIGVAW
ncbi:hypothetical protein C7271_09945, partial [filamentous cyanobacterium CCP5]